MIRPKYTDLSKQIQEAIKSGKWQERLPGVFRLATEYSVDPATVSKALRLLEQKGIVTINGRRGTFITKRPARKVYRVTGIVGINSESPSLNIIKEYFGQHNYQVMVISQNDDLLRSNPQLWAQLPIDGLIFMNSTLTRELICDLRHSGMPFVSANKIVDLPGVTWVDFGSEEGLRDLIEYFYKLGHRRIAFVDVYYNHNNFTERLRKIYLETCKKLKCLDEELFYTPETAVDIAENFLAMNTGATAIISLNRKISLELKQLAENRGLKIPGDLSLAAYKPDKHDDFFTISYYQNEERSRYVAELLLEKIHNPDAAVKQITLPNTLITGKSSAQINNIRS